MRSLPTDAEQWIENAQRRLEAARLLSASELPADSLSRAYFAVFHAARALLAARGIHPRTHSGTHRALGEHFRNRLDTRFASALSTDRDKCDYRLFVPAPDYAKARLERAETFVREATKLIEVP